MRSVATRCTALAAGIVLVGSGLLGGCGSGGSPSNDKSLAISVGRQPYAGGNSPITQYMKEHKLFEKAAKKYGYTLKVDYRDYPAAAPMVESMIGGRLDFGMWGDTPVISSVARKQPVSILSMGEGHLRFLLATRKSSGITNLSELRGKKVGLLIGGDPELAFFGMLKGVLGTADVNKLGIKLVNIPTQAAAAKVPKGVDATVLIRPAYLKERETDKNVVAIANSYGYTEAGYKGPAGTGASHLLPGAKKSPFAPEGFYGHRSMWVVRNGLLKDHPKVVSAFVTAEQKATEALVKMPPKKVSQLVYKYWKLKPADGAKIVKDELDFRRGWIWATKGDAEVLLKLSQLMAANKVIPKAPSWDQIKASFKMSAEAIQAGYKAAGSYPQEKEFTVTGKDVRGLPSWQVDKWGAPKASNP